jgi:hypothetical protein
MTSATTQHEQTKRGERTGDGLRRRAVASHAGGSGGHATGHSAGGRRVDNGGRGTTRRHHGLGPPRNRGTASCRCSSRVGRDLAARRRCACTHSHARVRCHVVCVRCARVVECQRRTRTGGRTAELGRSADGGAEARPRRGLAGDRGQAIHRPRLGSAAVLVGCAQLIVKEAVTKWLCG